MNMAGIVAYFRVSTKQQGESGLGLEGQQAAVETYARQAGLTVVARYTEVESGKRADRPELARALAHARRNKGTLVVAKLDRLSRDPDFLGAMMKASVDFVCCDMPTANKLTIRIMAAVAEQEREAISARTKAALAAAKARGTLLGSARPGHWDGREESRLAGLQKARIVAAKTLRETADAAYSDLAPVLTELRGRGLSLQAIANELTSQGHTTRRGMPWNAVQVSRVLARMPE
jgi:DNA invertase Pin-like site-specific DNA recombinase